MLNQAREVFNDARDFANRHPIVTYVFIRACTPAPVQVAVFGTWIASEAYEIYRFARGVPS